MNENSNTGSVVSVRGSVVDARFPVRLPKIYNVLCAGDSRDIVIEVNTHLSDSMVRGVALTPTQGLARRSEIIDTGFPLQVPVGKGLLGSVVNVFGKAIDMKGEVQGELTSIHQKTVPLTEQSTVSEIFETGIKAIDVLAPLERGGKAGLFGGAGVGELSGAVGTGRKCGARRRDQVGTGAGRREFVIRPQTFLARR
ncbi:MAG TPA: hypothetical protein PKM95_09615, partial [Deltaproteobacteria bacterium]|nr:hypothetical protein [Deltaproteobacteria bacterium]